MSENGDIQIPAAGMVSGEKVVEHTLQRAALDRAHATPLPGALAVAFGPDSINAGGVPVRKVVGADWEIFQLTDSPILELFKELQKPEGAQDEVKWTKPQEWELAYQFTRPAREIYDLVCEDRAAFSERAKDLHFSLEQPEIVILAVMEQIKRHLNTRLEFAAQAQENGDTTFFRDTPAKPKTASAGSLNTMAA